MAKAITEVVDGNVGLKAAAKAYNVPRSTLQRRIKIYKVNSNLEMSIVKRNKINFAVFRITYNLFIQCLF